MDSALSFGASLCRPTLTSMLGLMTSPASCRPKRQGAKLRQMHHLPKKTPRKKKANDATVLPHPVVTSANCSMADLLSGM